MTEPLLIVAALNGTRDRKVSKGVPYTAAELANGRPQGMGRME